MRLIVLISAFLLLHSSILFPLNDANEIEKKQIASNYERRHNKDNITMRLNNSEIINHLKLEGKKKKFKK